MTTLLRTGGFSTKLIAGSYTAGAARPQYPAPNVTRTVRVKDSAADLTTAHSLQTLASQHANGISLLSGVQSVKCISVVSRRYAHSDVTFPNFDGYRHDSTKDPNKPASETDDVRRLIPSTVVYGVGGLLSIYFAKGAVQAVASYKGMAGDQMALANIEIDLNEVPEGKCKTFEWRGKPVFVRHRTAQEIEDVRAVNVSDLRHPESDESRVKKPEWTVLIGVCTHLGCIPFAGLGDFGGYYCPCHGSHYDASGRIRKGPAPLNLHIPEYSFLDDNTIRVG